MELLEKFRESEKNVKCLSKRPSNDELLKLYALFKQATKGDVEGKRPSLINVKERAKWDAWKNLEGTDKNQAMKSYTNVVDKLITTYGTKV